MALPRFSFLLNIWNEFSDDRIPTVAGGITFFFLLALFPAVASIVSLYGLFADRHAILAALGTISQFLPGGANAVLSADIKRLMAQKPATLNLTFLAGFLFALWTAAGGIKAIIDGLNIAFEVKETRSFVRLSINAILFAFVSVATVSVLVYVFDRLSPTIHSIETTALLKMVVDLFLWLGAFFLTSITIAVVYHFGPDRHHLRWQWLTWGSCLAAIFWMLGTLAFAWYVDHFGSYNRTYGDLGAAVGFLTWVWLSFVIILSGAEINYEIDHERGQRDN